MDLSEADKADLRVNRATTTPLWKGFVTLVKYRTTRNYRNVEFLAPRFGDKLIVTFLMGTLYLGIGDKLNADNYINISSVLFMWCTMPAYAPLSVCYSVLPATLSVFPAMLSVFTSDSLPSLSTTFCNRSRILACRNR